MILCLKPVGLKTFCYVQSFVRLSNFQEASLWNFFNTCLSHFKNFLQLSVVGMYISKTFRCETRKYSLYSERLRFIFWYSMFCRISSLSRQNWPTSTSWMLFILVSRTIYEIRYSCLSSKVNKSLCKYILKYEISIPTVVSTCSH